MSALTFGYTWRIEPHWIELVRRTLPIANLPEHLVGQRLVQISDIHVGPVVSEPYLISAMQKVSAVKPDILTITGDFMTAQDVEQVSAVSRVLSHLQPARLATVGILGNHDYGTNWSNHRAADSLAKQVTSHGITLLRNQTVDVQGLQIIGIDDLWGTNFNLPAALATHNPTKPAIALCHNPDACDLPTWNGYRGWILSGHTHGGQCKPPFLPPPLIPVKNRRYTSGEFDLYGGRTLYINRGVGYLHRVRFNARPEITIFSLARA